MRWGKTESLSLTEKLSRENKFIVKKKNLKLKQVNPVRGHVNKNESMRKKQSCKRIRCEKQTAKKELLEIVWKNNHVKINRVKKLTKINESHVNNES